MTSLEGWSSTIELRPRDAGATSDFVALNSNYIAASGGILNPHITEEWKVTTQEVGSQNSESRMNTQLSVAEGQTYRLSNQSAYRLSSEF